MASEQISCYWQRVIFYNKIHILNEDIMLQEACQFYFLNTTLVRGEGGYPLVSDPHQITIKKTNRFGSESNCQIHLFGLIEEEILVI